MSKEISDTIKSGTKPMCNHRTCRDYSERFECYTHAYLLCPKYPNPPQDLINQINLDNKTRR